jgi:hypothetical protein
MIEQRDVEVLMDAFAEVVNGHLAQMAVSLRAEFDRKLEERVAAVRGERSSETTPDISTAVLDCIQANRHGVLESIVRMIPAPKDGVPGKQGDPGKDAPPVDKAEIVAEVLRQIPPAVNGIDGKDGQPGRDGVDGRDGIHGRDGIDGKDGRDGMDGKDGSDGKDAVLPDLEPIVQRSFDIWFSKFGIDAERRMTDMVQRAIERMPKPKDGKDAFELEDLTVDHDGHGNVTLTFIRGEFKRSFTLRFPCFEFRGIFKDGERYMSGNGVQFGGHFWIATADEARGKPGDRDTDWIMAVRRGRDGHDGIVKNGKPEGPVKL